MPIIVRIKIAVEMIIAILLFRHIVKFRSNMGIIHIVAYTNHYSVCANPLLPAVSVRYLPLAK